MLLGASALRIFRGSELAELIEHVARTHPRPVDAADGRAPRLACPPPSRTSGAKPARSGARPHPAPCGCGDCQEWARAIIAAPAAPRDDSMPAIRPPAIRAQRSPWADTPKPAPTTAPDWVQPAQLGGVLAGIAGGAPAPTLQEALPRSVRWERTRCYASEGKRCKPGVRHPCVRCVDVDFPFRASVDGRPWKLRYAGKHAPLVLVVDGLELGPVAQVWPVHWRTGGAPTPPVSSDEIE